MSGRCLICAKPDAGELEYHKSCSRNFFGTWPPPTLDVALDDLQQYAAISVLERITVTGVQKKLSVNIERHDKDSRFTVVGLWGNFILKPPVEEYPHLPENEDIIMRIASLAGIPVVPHAMIRLASGELAFITRRIDRVNRGEKIAMEDFCQISGRLTEDKYKGSVERIGRLLNTYSVYPGLDAVDLFERVIFNYLCGNADMHLKNYSLVETSKGMRLSPAYDLVSTKLVIPDDPEESALTINGKKARLSKKDFDTLADSLGVRKPAAGKIFQKFTDLEERFTGYIKTISYLGDSMQQTLCDLIRVRMTTFR